MTTETPGAENDAPEGPTMTNVTARETELREWLSFSDEHETYPFTEDDNANIHGYGHQDKAEFAAAVNRWDLRCGGVDDPEDGFDASVVTWKWAVMDPDGERFWVNVPATDERVGHLFVPGPVNENTPGAFPITCIWWQR